MGMTAENRVQNRLPREAFGSTAGRTCRTSGWPAAEIPVEPRRLRRVLAAVLLVGLSAGCNTADGVNTETPTPGTTTTAVSSPTPTTDEQRVLAQYAAFWKILTPTSEAPESQRREMLARYATDPELTRALGGMRGADRLGEVLYGEVVPRPTVTKIEGDSASIRDCQNASNAGRRDRHRRNRHARHHP